MSFLQRHRFIRRLLLGVGIPLASLLFIVIVVGFVYDFGGLVEKQVRAQAPKIEEQIGRPLRVGQVRLKLLPWVRMEIRDIALEAAPGQTGILAQPLVQVGALRARVALWPLLISLGKKLEVTSFEVADLRVNVVRSADGRLSYQDILDKRGTQPESPPPTPEEIERLGGILLRHVGIRDAGIYFYDLSTPTGAAVPLRLDNIQFALENAQLFAPFSLTLDMAVLSSVSNFHLGLTVGPLPRDLQVQNPLLLLRRAEFSLSPIEIEPLLRFLPPAPGIGLAGARIEAQLKLETPADSGQLQFSASAAARHLVLDLEAADAPPGSPPQRGTPADLRIQTQLKAVPAAGDIQVEKLELSVNDMALSAQADLRNLWTTPAINKLSLSSRGLLLEKLLAVLPPSALPKDAVLRGPLLVRGAVSGTPTAALVEVALDLTPASLILPSFAKPAETPLLLELRGRVNGAGQGADIERFGLNLGPLALLLHGKVRSADDLDLTLDSGSVDLERLLRLLPSVERATSKNRIEGTLQVSGTAKKHGDTLDLTTHVAMTSAYVNGGDLTLRGNAGLTAQVHSTPASASVKSDLDLTGAQLRLPGSVDKGQGVPMRMRVQIERGSKLVRIQLAELTVPGGTIRLVGQVDMERNQIDVKLPLVDLDLSRLGQVLPGLRRSSVGGLLDSRLKIAFSFDGNPNRLATARARLDQFDLAVAGGTLKGSGEVIGLDAPRKITFNFVGDRLDLDAILGPPGSETRDEPARGDSRPAPIPGFLRRLEMNGRVQVNSGRYKATPVRDLLLEVTMSGGKLLLKTLRGQALGGSVNAGGSTFDFGPSQPRFALHAKLDRIEISQVLSMRGSDVGKKLSGRGSLDLSANGQGYSWADIAPRITGQLGLGLTEARWEAAGVSSQVIAPLLAAAAKQLKQGAVSNDLGINNLSANFRIDNGKLHTSSPLRFGSDQGSVVLNGSIGLDKSLLLTGNLDLSPKVISAATGGKLVPDAAIPVGLRVGGSLTGPRFEIVDIGKTVAALAAAIMRGRGKELLGGAAAQPLRNVLGGALNGTPSNQPTAPANSRQKIEDAAKRGLGGLLGR